MGARFSSSGATSCLPTAGFRFPPPSMAPEPKSSSATTTTSPPFCRCRRERLQTTMACSWVNHEYASPYLMFPAMTDEDYRDKLTTSKIRAVAASTGISVVEVKKSGASGNVVTDGQYNRRVHMGTEMRLSGPAAGDDRLKTSIDPRQPSSLARSPTARRHHPVGTMLSGRKAARTSLPATTPRSPTRTGRTPGLGRGRE